VTPPVHRDLLLDLATRNELPLARFLADRRRALGVEAEVLPITQTRGTLRARLRGSCARPALAHQTNEWVPVDSLVQAAELYVRLAATILAA